MKKIILTVALFLVTAVSVEAATPARVYVDGASALKVGEKKTVKIMVDSGTYGVSAFGTKLVLNGMVKANSIDFNTTNFQTAIEKKISGSTVNLTVLNDSKTTGNLPKGIVEVATMEIEGVTTGQAEIKFELTEVAGDGVNVFDLTVENGTMTVSEDVVVDGVSPILNFKVAMLGVAPANECAVGWTAQVLVKNKAGNMKNYSGVLLVRDTSVTNKAVFKGSVKLTDWTAKTELLAFIKGEKHIQLKYGENNQTGSFDTTVGKLIVDTTASSPTYDFTGYPLIPGDVNQDGKINSLDFSVIKSDSHKSVEPGQNLRTDLDGSCQTNGIDTTLMANALIERQDEIY